MRKAKVNGHLVLAGPDSATEAECPFCGGRVKKRERRRMDGQMAYFCRHERRVGEGCQLRYRPA